MSSLTSVPETQVVGGEWITFPGGELEGTRPRALCHACRARLQRQATAGARDTGRVVPSRGAVCFQCYRTELDRDRALRAARDINTATDARFQALLPFGPVNRARLLSLRAERERSQIAGRSGTGRHAHQVRRAQIAARCELQRVAAGVDAAQADQRIVRARLVASAIHAAELQLPDSWLPFVVAR